MLGQTRGLPLHDDMTPAKNCFLRQGQSEAQIRFGAGTGGCSISERLREEFGYRDVPSLITLITQQPRFQGLEVSRRGGV